MTSPRLPGRAVLLLAVFRDKSRRALLFTMVGIPATLLMVVWKAALFMLAPSLFLLATVLFTLGVAAAKIGIIRSHINVRKRQLRLEEVDTVAHRRRVYRRTGVVVTALSVVYTLSFVPMLRGTTHDIRYDRNVAILIAAVTFAEISLAIHGAVSARRNRDSLIEAVKLTNLAGAFVLLTLTQSALLSIDPETQVGNANAISGLVFGSLATGVGGWMLWRSRASADLTADNRPPLPPGTLDSINAAPNRGGSPTRGEPHVGRLARRSR